MKLKCDRMVLVGLGLAIIVFLINQLPNLVDVRPVMYDEAWYGDTAYNLAHGRGFLNSIVGTRGNSNFLLPLLTAGFMLLFGYNLLAIRLAAVFCGLITILFLWLSLKQMRVGKRSTVLALLYFVSISFYNTVFRFGRPECAAIMCMAIGLWFYLRYKDSESWLDIFALSIFVWLAGCAHPYSLLMFAILGAYIFIKAIRKKNWKVIAQLALLVIAAVGVIVVITYVSKTYNGPSENYINDRFSIQNVLQALPVYYKDVFLSKTSIIILPLLLVLFYIIQKNNEHKELAIVGLIHLVFFPVLFSTDLMMVGLGVDYVIYVATLLIGPFLNQFVDKRKYALVFITFCICNLCVSYYYNYGIKYERANSVLASDFSSIIPKGSKVFGPIRQWPMVMDTDYQSDHTSFPLEPIEKYDFVVLNSQDSPIYDSYRHFVPINEDVMQLVYEKTTRQYGLVQIYRRVR